MKKNLYYRSVIRRDNTLLDALATFFFRFASFWRIPIETFIRKDFGERYFRLSWVISFTLLFGLWPVLWEKTKSWVRSLMNPFANLAAGSDPMAALGGNPYASHAGQSSQLSLFPQYLAWYVFLAALLAFGIRHHLDQKRSPSVFDFARYSRYSGRIDPLFYKISFPGRATDLRVIECYLEPGLFFILGIFLSLIGQKLGGLLMISSMFYAFSYWAAYRHGDNFVMDTIDEMICNKSMEESFVDGMKAEDPSKFRMAARTPQDPEHRRQLLEQIIEDDDMAIAK